MEIKTVRTSGVAPHIPVIEELNVTDNGTYTATSGVDGYSPVSVNVQPNLGTKNITANGTYTASSDSLDGYSSVTVDVQEQPWQPLEDGYSNFWFELTDDTLSPWLNFSAKNNDAVIDWGDGSGEQSLDTLTPTHTYSKAGKYVVKVKGVTGIGRQQYAPYGGKYLAALKYIELNNDVTSFVSYTFLDCVGLKAAVLPSSMTLTNNATFQYCTELADIRGLSKIVSGGSALAYCFCLEELEVDEGVTEIGASAIGSCISLKKITLPSTITTIGSNAFAGSQTLDEIHIKAIAPPTLGTAPFNNIAANWVCYVPVGTGETYKAAAGWSAYSDHILEEGQTVTRAMQSKFKKEAEKSDNDEDKR